MVRASFPKGYMLKEIWTKTHHLEKVIKSESSLIEDLVPELYSESTVRRDELEAENKLRRIHGGGLARRESLIR